MGAVARSVSPVWKRICRIGMRVANEKMFITAESRLNTMVITR